MGIWDRNAADDQMDIWDIVRRIFPSFLVIEGMVIRQMHAQGEKNLDYVDRAGCTGTRR